MAVHWSDALIVFYLFVAWCWNYPDDSPAKLLLAPFSRIVSWLGLWHSWNMFAPNPLRDSRRIAVQVNYSDGSRYEWRPPGTLSAGYWADFLYAHHRKFTEVVCAGKNKPLGWSTCQFALRQLAERLNMSAVPVHIALIEEKWPVKLGEVEQPREPICRTVFEQRLTDGVLK